jgi:hypothetical protein
VTALRGHWNALFAAYEVFVSQVRRHFEIASLTHVRAQIVALSSIAALENPFLDATRALSQTITQVRCTVALFGM